MARRLEWRLGLATTTATTVVMTSLPSCVRIPERAEPRPQRAAGLMREKTDCYSSTIVVLVRSTVDSTVLTLGVSVMACAGREMSKYRVYSTCTVLVLVRY